MAAASAVRSAAKRLELLDSDCIAFDRSMRVKFKSKLSQLQCMQSGLREVEKNYDDDPTVSTCLSEIKKLARDIEDALESDFIEFILKRTSVFKRMLLVFSCIVEDERKNCINDVLDNMQRIIHRHAIVEVHIMTMLGLITDFGVKL